MDTLYQRMRRQDFYLHDTARSTHVTWAGEAPGERHCCYVMLDTYGAENITSFADDLGAWLVRRRFGGEGELSPASSPAGLRWEAHCAQRRQNACSGRVIDVATHPIGLKRLIAESPNMVVFQGNLDASGQAPRVMLLGQEVSMPLGALRLSRRTGLPLRFVRVQAVGTRWEVAIEPEMPADESALLARIACELRERPETWMLWPSFLDAIDAGADDAQVNSQRPAAGSAPGSAA